MRSRRFLPLLAVAGAFGGALWWVIKSGEPLLRRAQPLTSPTPVVARAAYDPALVHKTLEFYAAQTRYDPGNAMFKASLASQYLESYRETGDSADATRAEQAARASLGIRTHGNSAAYFQLSRALLTEHRFPEALTAARQASAQDPVGLRECADIEIEVGDYAAATRDIKAAKSAVADTERAVAAVHGNVLPPTPDDDPASLALTARLNELHGDAEGQLALLERATKLADDNADMPVQSVAWFHERLGRCLSMMGRLDEAEQSYRVGLHAFPRDYRTMAALAHLYAARGDWQQTITWADKAANIVPAPETLALLGDAYAALGEPQKAAAQFRLVETIGTLSRAQGIIYDRQRALYYADHDHDLAAAVTLARGELRVRHDIYTYDTLGWTLFKAGHLAEAAVNAKKSLAYGTRDASLYYHAGMITAAQGQNQLAQTYLERALAINPYFHPTQPATARAVLARLKASPSPEAHPALTQLTAQATL